MTLHSNGIALESPLPVFGGTLVRSLIEANPTLLDAFNAFSSRLASPLPLISHHGRVVELPDHRDALICQELKTEFGGLVLDPRYCHFAEESCRCRVELYRFDLHPPDLPRISHVAACNCNTIDLDAVDERLVSDEGDLLSMLVYDPKLGIKPDYWRSPSSQIVPVDARMEVNVQMEGIVVTTKISALELVTCLLVEYPGRTAFSLLSVGLALISAKWGLQRA